jgi:hypothetical protein
MARKDVNVWIATDANGQPSRVCVADPASLDRGDTVRWVNNTGGDIIVFFPHARVLGRSRGHFHHKVTRGESYSHPGRAARRTRGRKPEQYSYSIYCSVTKRFAVGGSDPEIIIT